MQNIILKPNTPEHLNSLSPLGLHAKLFEQIGERILQAYVSTTKNDARMAPGMFAFLAAVRAVRDILKPNGWEAKREESIELVTNKELSIDILVSSGNKFIGCEDGFPGNKNPKGKNTQRIVYINAQQLLLFPNFDSHNRNDDNVTYFLFYHFDLKKEEMRMELSLPNSFNITERKVEGWRQRIFLKSIDFNGTEIIDPTQDEYQDEYDEYIEDIEFKIKRK